MVKDEWTSSSSAVVVYKKGIESKFARLVDEPFSEILKPIR